MSAGFYKQSRLAANQLFLVFRLAYDVEITTFREEGRDMTFKALKGDHLAFSQNEDGTWIPVDGYEEWQVDEDFVPVGDA